MRLLKFIFKFLTTIVIGLIIGWYMAETQIPIKLKTEFINYIDKSGIYSIAHKYIK